MLTRRIGVAGVWIGLLLIPFLGRTFSAEAQTAEKIIELKPAEFPFEPQEFFIKKILDQRTEKGPIGMLSIRQGSTTKTEKLVFKGGLTAALDRFLTKSIERNTNLRPILLNIRELKITETNQSPGLIRGEVQLSISFEIERNNEGIKLLEYKGGSRYTRSVRQLTDIEEVLNKSLMHSLQYFNKWINREASSNEKLAEKVKITFTDYEKAAKNDTLFYAPGRRLNWSDFKGKPQHSSRFAAEIFPFLSFEESSQINNSVIEVNLNLKIYLVRSFSWVKDYGRNSYTLNHEQRHFDLVKLAAEQFKKKLNTTDLTVDNYEGIISYEYLEALREMNRMQVQYDRDTRHGTDQQAQQNWNIKIDKELSTLNLYGAN